MNKNEDRYPLATGIVCGASIGVGVAAAYWVGSGYSVVATVLLGLIVGAIAGIATYATESN